MKRCVGEESSLLEETSPAKTQRVEDEEDESVFDELLELSVDNKTLTGMPTELLARMIAHLDLEDRWRLRETTARLRGIVDDRWKDLGVVHVQFLTEGCSKRETDSSCSCPTTSVPRRSPRFRPSRSTPSAASFSFLQAGGSGSFPSLSLDESLESADAPSTSSSKTPMASVECTFNKALGLSSHSKIFVTKVPIWVGIVGRNLSTLSLSFKDCPSMNPAEEVRKTLNRLLAQLGDSCPALAHLSISSCYLIKDPSFLRQLASLARSRPGKLKSLTLELEASCVNAGIDSLKPRLAGIHFPGEDFLHAAGMEHHQFESVFHQLEQGAGSCVRHRPDYFRPLHDLLEPGMFQNLLEQLLMELKGVETLNVDKLVSLISVQFSAIPFPRSVRVYPTSRLGAKKKQAKALFDKCPLIEEVTLSCKLICSEDLMALGSLGQLKSLTLQSLINPNLFISTLLLDGGGNPVQCLWPQLRSLTLTACQLTDSWVDLMTRTLQSLETLELSAVTETSSVSEGGLCRLGRLRRLRHLTVELPVQLGRVFSDSMLDTICDHLLSLESLSARRAAVSPLSVPRLLRTCRRLRKVKINLSVALNNLDGVVMIRSLAADLSERTWRTELEITEIRGVDYESVSRIQDGLPKACDLLLSRLTDYCLHDREECLECGFESVSAPLRKRQSLVLGRTDFLTGAIVFLTSA